MVKFSVVVPVYNAEKTIKQCVESLIAQSFNDYEVIIVDNNSNDGSSEIIEECMRVHSGEKIKLIREEKKGTSPARNRGIESSSGDIVAFTDSDCVADRNWLGDTVSAFDREEIGAVAGNIQGYNPTNLVEKFLSLFTLRGLKEEKIFGDYTLLEGGFSTANLSVKRHLLNKIGGFRGPKYSEDHDLCARLYDLGYKVRYVTNALVFHIHRSTLGGLMSQSFHFGRGHAYLLRKWGRDRLIIEFPKHTYQNQKFVFPVWLNVNYADKKMAFFIWLGFLHSLLWIVPIVYFLYLCINIQKRAKRDKMKVSFPESIGLTFLLLIKSMAMTCGRIYGSFKYHVICI